MTVTVKHSKTNAISDWTQAQLDEQISLGNFPAGTTLANIVLPSDWNNDHTLTGVGTMAEQNANSVAITGGSVNGTTIGATTASTGKFTSVTTPSVTATSTDLTLSAISTGAVVFNTLNGTQFKVTDNGGSSVNFWQATGASTSNWALLNATGSDTNVSGAIVSKGTGSLIFSTNSASGNNQMRISHTASAVNYVQVTGAATGSGPIISTQGSDTNATLTLRSKGTFAVTMQSSAGANIFEAIPTASSVNYLRVAPSIASSAPILSAQGSDTNISMAFQPKGTGAIDLAAGSSGVNISNGGTVTAITRTAAGTGYTSLPTMTISAPTTAGGVQATATYTMGLAGVPTITSGGTGYTVGDTLTFVGGTGGVATLTVSTVSAGVITGVTVGSFGTYTALPTNPISVIGGTGSSATFTATWAINSGFTITNAGSGYIEQPTVTFSGGGGSGASAYATVGSIPTVKTIGSALSFTTPSSEVFRIVDANSTGQNYISLESSGGGSNFRNAGAGTNLSTYFISKGTGTISFATNASTSTEQLRVSHTASAVNYVQVTGGATGNGPTISTQGSDTNAFLAITSKGTSAIRLQTGGSSQVLINNTTSAINQLGLTGSTTGQACSIITQGSDTNIDLALTPKGTGRVKFGTYTANMALTIQGYIEILDSGGTLRKLAVIA